MTVAEMVKNALRDERLSVIEGAAKAGVGRTTMFRLVNGDGLPQVATLRKLADTFDGLDFNAMWDAAMVEDHERSTPVKDAA